MRLVEDGNWHKKCPCQHDTIFAKAQSRFQETRKNIKVEADAYLRKYTNAGTAKKNSPSVAAESPGPVRERPEIASNPVMVKEKH